MEQRLTFITLGADNLTLLREFYTTVFGWTPIAENKDIVFFKLNGIMLGIFGRDGLAEASGVASEGTGFRSFTLAYNVETKDEIDPLYEKLKYKGVKVLKEPENTLYGGYNFIIADPEGNVFEFAWNPFLLMDDNGDVITHHAIE